MRESVLNKLVNYFSVNTHNVFIYSNYLLNALVFQLCSQIFFACEKAFSSQLKCNSKFFLNIAELKLNAKGVVVLQKNKCIIFN